MGERIKPSEVRAKGTKSQIRDYFRVADWNEAYWRHGIVLEDAMHDALIHRAKGLNLQNPRPGDLKRVREV